ncbi:MAG: 9-O-acetylesterase [Planctomycetota bacterium]|nr:9-O-acetylesterase [Planctomycetota bacterium]
MRNCVFLALLACLLTPRLAHAEVRLPAIISTNMVLQANKPVPIWGWAAPGEKVTVTLGPQKLDAVADASGQWRVTLKELKAMGGEDAPLEMTVAGTNKIVVGNILVGTVWLCSGQSNMSFGLRAAQGADVEVPKAKHRMIRLFQVPHTRAALPQADVVGAWSVCTPASAAKFSAVAYFFGRDVHEATGLPTGLIQSSVGGTPAQSWTSLEGLKMDKALAAFAAGAEGAAKNYPARLKHYNETIEERRAAHKQWEAEVGQEYLASLRAWEAEVAKAKLGRKPLPKKPEQPAGTKPEPEVPDGPNPDKGHPASLYNGMIAPLAPFAIEGAIWYQGEANVGIAPVYATLFPCMIRAWRERWGEGDFPFYFVQLANFLPRKPEPSESGWAALREAQTRTLALPHAGMAVTIDIGDGSSIHPTNKTDVGHRLAQWALHDTFGKPVVRSGPLFSGAKVEGDHIRVSFKEIGGGLVARPAPPSTQPETKSASQPSTQTSKPGDQSADLVGFAIAGADGKFTWAKARIDGETVVVSSDKVPAPAFVRYAWADNPACNLYNKEGLPASPFRSDLGKVR